jgi:uncharacterized protein (DUF433 family)
MSPVISQHIEMIPSANHGEKAVIRGTRIRVLDVYVWHELQRKSDREIVAEFPQLSLADVHAALTFYWDNEELIRQQMQQADEIADELRSESSITTHRDRWKRKRRKGISDV